MIIVARIGGQSGIEMVADTDDADTTPTPEWIEDTIRRLARTALETYNALPDGALAEVTPDEPDAE